jgi:phytoene synthase
MTTIDDAYTQCEAIVAAQAKNFAYGIRLLPTPKRTALSAVYALARRIDDVGDGDLPPSDKLDALTAIRKSLTTLPGAGDDPVLVAIDDTARRYDLPMEQFNVLIDGCEMDVNGRAYITFDDLVDYCRHVAGSIGQLSLAVFGTKYPQSAVPRADALGVALQVTNILRDVIEDGAMGRVYLPSDDATKCGCAADLTGSDEARASLIRFEAKRAREWFQKGLELLPLLDRRSRACVAAMAGIYLRLLNRIEADPGAVWQGRVSVPTTQKLWVAARAVSVGQP